jgi:hypothetical protein
MMSKYDNVLIIGLIALVLAHVTPPGISQHVYAFCAPVIIWAFLFLNLIDWLRSRSKK